MVIYLACRLPGRSSGLTERHSGPDQPCSLIWPCSQWGLPSQPVTRLLVRSYRTVSPLPWRGVRGEGRGASLPHPPSLVPRPPPWRFAFFFTFPIPPPPAPARTVGVYHPPSLWSPGFPFPPP